MIFSPTPDMDNIIGVYRIDEARNMNIDPGLLKKCRLQLSKNGKFAFKNRPFEWYCDSGKFTIRNKINELQVECEQSSMSFMVERGLFEYRIYLNLADPDFEHFVYFVKTNN
jgi:hypothetical protein